MIKKQKKNQIIKKIFSNNNNNNKPKKRKLVDTIQSNTIKNYKDLISLIKIVRIMNPRRLL